MSTAIAKVKAAMIAAGAAATMLMLASTANAANCRSIIDEDGDSVVMCGSTALYDEDDGDDEDDSRGFVYDEDEGSLMVDLENCEPGKFWMMETDEADDIPLPCR